MTISLSVLEGLAAPGRDNLVFQPAGKSKVEIVEWGSVGMTVPRVLYPVLLPPVPNPSISAGNRFLAVLAAGFKIASKSSDSVFKRILLRCAQGEVVATDGTVSLIQGGFRLPGKQDVVIPLLSVD